MIFNTTFFTALVQECVAFLYEIAGQKEPENGSGARAAAVCQIAGHGSGPHQKNQLAVIANLRLVILGIPFNTIFQCDHNLCAIHSISPFARKATSSPGSAEDGAVCCMIDNDILTVGVVYCIQVSLTSHPSELDGYYLYMSASRC